MQTKATGSSGERPAAMRLAAIVPICFIAMYITITGEPEAMPCQLIRSGTRPEES
ncbi:hypothetical protein D3C86_2182310 [compost metagenome]